MCWRSTSFARWSPRCTCCPCKCAVISWKLLYCQCINIRSFVNAKHVSCCATCCTDNLVLLVGEIHPFLLSIIICNVVLLALTLLYCTLVPSLVIRPEDRHPLANKVAFCLGRLLGADWLSWALSDAGGRLILSAKPQRSCCSELPVQYSM